MEQIALKHLHMLIAAMVFLFFLIRAFPILIQKIWKEQSTMSTKILVACQHTGYSLLVLSGLGLLWYKDFAVQPWFYAKILLFIVILSACSKAFKRRIDRLLIQRQAGLIVALIAYCALFALILIKPQFG
ncbi:invasion protein expression up-regulator SirB [Acinetobacter qingfengensis]|uniref:Uncharacterized protein n=1 Tax=Acinetobacter qingfengensis TaxID=1262585 RepID=A0A1E7QWF4_9GAMM|nr:SirB2 family protein [Acinetobacter qingfengensis]KAA8731325.1 invasion protein expression up-regulator SirB [Acinetobacter qingfengensis]OEY91429.1 hypothetical protein BJI46_06740 [Acinetobacter qingfengensis]